MHLGGSVKAVGAKVVGGYKILNSTERLKRLDLPTQMYIPLLRTLPSKHLLTQSQH